MGVEDDLVGLTRAKPSSTASAPLFETLAMAMVMNTGWMNSNTSPPPVFAALARHGWRILAAAAGRDQADTGLDEADVAFQRDDALGGMHQELANRHPAPCPARRQRRAPWRT